MKLLIDGSYKEVGFWSFLKCNFITSAVVAAIVYTLAFVFILAIEG